MSDRVQPTIEYFNQYVVQVVDEVCDENKANSTMAEYSDARLELIALGLIADHFSREGSMMEAFRALKESGQLLEMIQEGRRARN